MSETAYIAPATFHEKGKPASQIIYSNVKEIVEHQRYVFDTLWVGAIPAEQRIEQIEEEGLNMNFFKSLLTKVKQATFLAELVRSMKREVLLFLPNNKAIVRIDNLGIIDYIIKASIEKKGIYKNYSSLK